MPLLTKDPAEGSNPIFTRAPRPPGRSAPRAPLATLACLISALSLACPGASPEAAPEPQGQTQFRPMPKHESDLPGGRGPDLPAQRWADLPAEPWPEPVAAPPPSSSFESGARPLTEPEKAAMRGVSWHPGCPLPLEGLARLELTHWGFDGEVHRGVLIVDAEYAPGLGLAFEALFAARFPVEKMQPIEVFGGDDDRSMEANNSSAFNCRKAVGTTHFSQHAYGRALDLNPLQNPYVKGEEVLPPGGRAHLDRGARTPGLIRADGPAVEAFTAQGWKWGGRWRSLKDYQHFSLTGS